MLLPNGATTLEDTIYVDATHMGNEARFLNHTCNPEEQNVRFKATYSEREPLYLTSFQATRDIEKGETLISPEGKPAPCLRLVAEGVDPLPVLLLVEAIKEIKKDDKLLISYVNTDENGVKTVFLDFQEECKCSATTHVVGTNAAQS